MYVKTPAHFTKEDALAQDSPDSHNTNETESTTESSQAALEDPIEQSDIQEMNIYSAPSSSSNESVVLSSDSWESF